jgi:hypothetical protein
MLRAQLRRTSSYVDFLRLIKGSLKLLSAHCTSTGAVRGRSRVHSRLLPAETNTRVTFLRVFRGLLNRLPLSPVSRCVANLQRRSIVSPYPLKEVGSHADSLRSFPKHASKSYSPTKRASPPPTKPANQRFIGQRAPPMVAKRARVGATAVKWMTAMNRDGLSASPTAARKSWATAVHAPPRQARTASNTAALARATVRTFMCGARAWPAPHAPPVIGACAMRIRRIQTRRSPVSRPAGRWRTPVGPTATVTPKIAYQCNSMHTFSNVGTAHGMK